MRPIPSWARKPESLFGMAMALLAAGGLMFAARAALAESGTETAPKPAVTRVPFIDLNGDGINDHVSIEEPDPIHVAAESSLAIIDPGAFQLSSPTSSHESKMERFQTSLLLSAGLLEYRGGMGALLEERYLSGVGVGTASLSNCVGGVCFPR